MYAVMTVLSEDSFPSLLMTSNSSDLKKKERKKERKKIKIPAGSAPLFLLAALKQLFVFPCSRTNNKHFKTDDYK